MQNKILPFIILSISFYSILFKNNSINAQSTSTSPFSSFGLGERDGLDHATYLGLGNTTITYFDSTTLNFYNPASYNTLAKGQPIFSTGISSRISKYKEGQATNLSKIILLNHFSMGFSFAKHFGIAFGLKPFSRRGYSFSTKEKIGTDSIKHSYDGSGSTNEVFLGFSSNILKLKNHQLAVGGNVGYVFGSLINERKTNIINATAGGIDQKTLKINALHYEFGMYYNQILNTKNSFALSAVVEPSQKLNSSNQYFLYTSKFIDNAAYYNKLDSTNQVKGSINLAPSTTIGLNYLLSFKDVKKGNQQRNSEISFHTSYNVTNWNKYSSTISDITTNPGYLNTNKFTFGVQYIPEKLFLSQSGVSNFIETIRYRVGCYQYTLPISMNGIAINDKGVTLGFGIPLRMQKSLSSINLGFAYGKRSNSISTALSEQYYGINLNVIFAPASFERWFIKRKFD